MPEPPAARRRLLPAAIALLASALAGCGAEPAPPAGAGATAAATPTPTAIATSSREDLAAARAAALAKIGGAGIHGRLLTHEGEPAVGARVLLRSRLPADEDAQAVEVPVIEDGTFALPVTGANDRDVELWALHPGHADWSRTVEVRGGWLDVGVHRLAPAQTLRGAVLTDAEGAALAAATVRVAMLRSTADRALPRAPGREDGIASKTDTEGRFELGPLPLQGFATLTAVAPGFLREVRQRIDLAANPDTITFRLKPGTAIEGVVRDDHGGPISGARVDAWPQDSELPALVTRTGEDGTFSVDGLQRLRLYRVEVRADGMRRVSRENVAGGTQDAAFELSPATLLIVDVIGLDAPDAPLHVEVHRSDAPSAAALAAADRAAGDDRPVEVGLDSDGELLVTVRARGCALAASTPFKVSRSAESLRVEVRCAPASSVEGLALGPDGAPLRDVEAWVVPVDATTAQRFQGPVRGRCDAAGRFRLAGLAAGSYRLEARAPALCRATRPAITVAVGEQLVAAPLQLAAGAAVEGTVAATAGPQENAWVEVTPRGADAPVFEAELGADGRFSLAEALPTGDYEVRAYHQDLLRVTKPRLVALQSFEVATPSGTVTVDAKRR